MYELMIKKYSLCCCTVLNCTEFAFQHLCKAFESNYKAKHISIKPFDILLEGHIFISFSSTFLEIKLVI